MAQAFMDQRSNINKKEELNQGLNEAMVGANGLNNLCAE
jgi:hypothetical protein